MPHETLLYDALFPRSTVKSLNILQYLLKYGPSSTLELSTHFAYPESTVWSVMRRLILKGYVTSIRGPNSPGYSLTGRVLSVSLEDFLLDLGILIEPIGSGTTAGDKLYISIYNALAQKDLKEIVA